jgi:succinate dehydrogenase/fumarate reductase-like Fe-S protein
MFHVKDVIIDMTALQNGMKEIYTITHILQHNYGLKRGKSISTNDYNRELVNNECILFSEALELYPELLI